MKTSRFFVFAAVAASLLAGFPASVRAEPTGLPAPSGEKVYVTIENFDPIQFDRLRLSRMTGEEIILATLKSSAAEQARFAGYAGEVIVLDENAKAPDGATVLRLTWNGKAVLADVTRDGKNNYLGVVNRLPLSYHPDFKRLQQSIDLAGLPDARRDAALRAETQMELYQALKYLVTSRAKPAGI